METKEKSAKDLNVKNIFAVPKIEKIVLNVGFGGLSGDQKIQEAVAAGLKKITGQAPSLTAAKKAIASFKIRKGQVIGAKVTLRGKKSDDFFRKLVSIVLPRMRDFRGVSARSFDGQGNYTLGFREFNVFPEIDYSKGEKQFGLEITIKTTAKTDEEARKLLEGLGMRFQKEKLK